ncbi:unnamed protein product [Fusarium graminearum]|uniref:Uncharacterized protein n=1 Tax=Gibberella zeae TaxID=5518 RepID=A0A4E9EHH6_GIBZA|nr:unnamed protein product [Fusarium graminearum]
MTGFPNKNTYVIEEASSGLYTPSLCAWEPSHTNDDKVLPSEVLAGEMSALTLESREHGEVLNAESPADTRSSAGSSSSHEPDEKLYLSKVASLNKDDVRFVEEQEELLCNGTPLNSVSLNDTVNIATLFGTPRKLSNPRLKGDKLIVRLKLRPSILAQFPTKTKPLEKKPTTKPLIREHNAHQLQFLDQLISEQSTELNRLNQERSITMQNIENYERVCSMHLDTLHRSLADACDLGMTSCELKDGDGDSTRLLKDDIQQMRQGVQNWSRILMEAKQDLASKKHQITMIATSLKTLEEERQQLSQWM